MPANTVDKLQSTIEVWKNTSAGTKWFVCFDLQGRETSKTVEGKRTFTLTTFERQINQDRAASPSQDLFRNGTFVLSKASDDTDPEEITSPNSLTDAEITEMAREIRYGDLKVKDAIEPIDSAVTLQRVYDALEGIDAHHSQLKSVKTKIDKLTNAPVEREPVYTTPDEEV